MKNRGKSRNKYMENMRNGILGKGKKIDEKTILLVVSGDTIALMQVVDAYQPYIKKLAKRKAIDKDGNTIEYVDETVKRTLEITLIASVMKFNPYM